MDHICHECGAEVEPGTPFCRKCNAPQIRVSTPQPAAGPEPPSHDDSTASGSGLGGEIASQKIDWRFARSRAALAAVVFLLVTMFVPFAAFLLISIPACGALAVYLYRRGRPGTAISAGAGARMGAVTGVFAFLLLMLLASGEAAYNHFVAHHSLLADVQSQLQKTIDASPDPQTRDMAKSLLTPSGIEALLFLSICFAFAMFLLLCSIGGALGAAIFGRPGTG